MKRKNTTIACLAVLLAILISSQVTAQDVRKEGRYWVGEITKSFQVSKGGTLRTDDVRGDIIVKTWDKNEVKIHERKRMDIYTKDEAEAAMRESENGYRQSGDRIEIGGAGFDRRWIESRFEIYVPVEFNLDIDTEGGDLSIDGLKGDVEGTTGGGDIDLMQVDGQVEVNTGGGNIDISRTTQKVVAKTGGGDVDVEDSQGSVRVSTGGGDVTIDNTRDMVDIRTGGGDVDIRETQGGVKVSTGGGDIEITDAGGDVNVRTGGGEIDIKNVNGNFYASTGGGSIETHTVIGSIEVKTGGGDIELENVQGAADISTGGGDVNLEITLTDFSKDHHVDIKTGGGDIHLSLPADLPATIHAEIKYRNRRWEDYEISSDFPLKITSDDEDSGYRIIRGVGDINGGGDRIDLKSGGGNIQIVKNR